MTMTGENGVQHISTLIIDRRKHAQQKWQKHAQRKWHQAY